jgi:two-component system, LuxR family, sensor kinase FixL
MRPDEEAMKTVGRAAVWSAVIGVLSVLPGTIFAQGVPNKPAVPKSVLLIMPTPSGRLAASMILDGTQDRISQIAGERVSVTVDSIPTSVGEKPILQRIELERLRAAYSDQHFDLIIAVTAPILSIVDKLRDELWPGVPVVFCALDQKSFESEPHFAGTTGIFAEYDWRGSVQLAQGLFPNLRHIAFAAGASQFDRLLNARMAGTVRELAPNAKFIDLSEFTFEQQVSLAQKLPPDTVLIVGSVVSDVSGHMSSQGPNSVRGLLSRSANSPVFQTDILGYRTGGLGGSVVDYEGLGREAADLALSVLNRSTPTDAPPVYSKAFQKRLDWRELQRWKVLESRVPRDATIDSRPASIWREYRYAVLLTAGAIFFQSFLIGILLYERTRRLHAQEALTERLRFESILSQVTTSFARLDSSDLEKATLRSLQLIRDYFDADRASVWLPTAAADAIKRVLVWPDAGTGSLAVGFTGGFENTIERVAGGQDVMFSNPAEMALLKDAPAFRSEGVLSFLAIPIRENNRVVGAFSVASLRKETLWPKEIVFRLRTIADVLGTGLARDRAERELRESELLKGSILASIRSSVAVVDRDGVIIEVNKKWADFAAENGRRDLNGVGVGANYLEVCRKASTNDPETQSVFEGILSVLNGSTDIFETEYACTTPKGQKWFRMTVDRLERLQGGAVISHLDVTERRRSELDRGRIKEELAHLNRVASMGNMAASLAHELAQPLAAILINTQAAERCASDSPPNIVEIREALADIEEDDRRAGAVVKNIRSLMKKAAITLRDLDLNAVVESVVGFVKNEAQLRGVQVRVLAAPGRIMVQGDEVPLQQVILNLMNNAMDAMSGIPSIERILTVSTFRRADTNSAWVTVQDEGAGISEETKPKLFTPFFTTKSDGLGMGLSISRNIMESLGGTISLESRPGRGASFRVELKLANA